MDARELRIGNIVINREDYAPFEITEGWEIDNIGLYEPIPLTEEWLLRFGFEKNENEVYQTYKTLMPLSVTIKDLYPTEKARIDTKFDVSKIPYPDNSIDGLRALHILEHFSFNEGQKVLEEWYRVLKPGGKLILEVPDFLAACRDFVNGNDETRLNLYGHFFAFPDLPGQIHKFMFTEDQLVCQLNWAKFKNIRRIQPMSGYVMPDTVHRFLAVEASK